MKTKLFYTIAALFICTIASQASDKVHVSSVNDFSTLKPSKTIDVKILESSALGEYTLSENDILHCDVIKISKPKRGKRNASFKVSPIYYIHDNEKILIEQVYTGKYASRILSKEEIKNIDAGKVGKKAALTVGNHFVKGIAPVASLAEGMVKNEEGNRLKSGVKQVYNDSVLSYSEKGEQLNLTPNDCFYIIFTPGSYTDSDAEYSTDN